MQVLAAECICAGVLYDSSVAAAPTRPPYKNQERRISFGIGGVQHMRNVFNPRAVDNGTHLWLVMHYVPSKISSLSINGDSKRTGTADLKDATFFAHTDDLMRLDPMSEDPNTGIPSEFHEAHHDEIVDYVVGTKSKFLPSLLSRRLATLQITPFATRECTSPLEWGGFNAVFRPDASWPVAILHLGVNVMKEGFDGASMSETSLPYVTSSAKAAHYDEGLKVPTCRIPTAPKVYAGDQFSDGYMQVAMDPNLSWSFIM